MQVGQHNCARGGVLAVGGKSPGGPLSCVSYPSVPILHYPPFFPYPSFSRRKWSVGRTECSRRAKVPDGTTRAPKKTMTTQQNDNENNNKIQFYNLIRVPNPHGCSFYSLIRVPNPDSCSFHNLIREPSLPYMYVFPDSGDL